MLIDVEHRSFEATLKRCAELGGADLIFTSPPYPTEVPGARGREGAPTRRYGGDTPEHFLWPDYQRLGDLCYRALKPGGFCIVIVDGPVRTIDKEIGSERSTIAFRLAEDWRWTRRHDGLRFRYVEHEAYLRLGPPGRFGPRRRSGWEPMHVFQRPGATGHFNVWAMSGAAATAGVRMGQFSPKMWSGRKQSGRRGAVYVQPERRSLSTALTAAAGGPVVNKELSDVEHPAPFTSHIAEVQVLTCSPPGGLVCDPFNGSGTTGVAAARNGRSFVGGDLGVRERDGRLWADVGRERALKAAGLPPQPAPTSESAAVEPVAPAAEQMSLLIA